MKLKKVTNITILISLLIGSNANIALASVFSNFTNLKTAVQAKFETLKKATGTCAQNIKQYVKENKKKVIAGSFASILAILSYVAIKKYSLGSIFQSCFKSHTPATKSGLLEPQILAKFTDQAQNLGINTNNTVLAPASISILAKFKSLLTGTNCAIFASGAAVSAITCLIIWLLTGKKPKTDVNSQKPGSTGGASVTTDLRNLEVGLLKKKNSNLLGTEEQDQQEELNKQKDLSKQIELETQIAKIKEQEELNKQKELEFEKIKPEFESKKLEFEIKTKEIESKKLEISELEQSKTSKEKELGEFEKEAIRKKEELEKKLAKELEKEIENFEKLKKEREQELEKEKELKKVREKEREKKLELELEIVKKRYEEEQQEAKILLENSKREFEKQQEANKATLENDKMELEKELEKNIETNKVTLEQNKQTLKQELEEHKATIEQSKQKLEKELRDKEETIVQGKQKLELELKKQAETSRKNIENLTKQEEQEKAKFKVDSDTRKNELDELGKKIRETKAELQKLKREVELFKTDNEKTIQTSNLRVLQHIKEYGKVLEFIQNPGNEIDIKEMFRRKSKKQEQAEKKLITLKNKLDEQEAQIQLDAKTIKNERKKLETAKKEFERDQKTAKSIEEILNENK